MHALQLLEMHYHYHYHYRVLTILTMFETDGCELFAICAISVLHWLLSLFGVVVTAVLALSYPTLPRKVYRS